jgi:hypothetical protein
VFSLLVAIEYLAMFGWWWIYIIIGFDAAMIITNVVCCVLASKIKNATPPKTDDTNSQNDSNTKI